MFSYLKESLYTIYSYSLLQFIFIFSRFWNKCSKIFGWDLRHGVSSGTGPFTLPEHMSSPQSVHVLEGFVLFILSNYVSMSLRFRTAIYYDTICYSSLLPFVFFLFFGSSCFFKMLFAFTDVQHDFHVTWCSCRLIVTRRVAQTE
jgi:hypothetical protein